MDDEPIPVECAVTCKNTECVVYNVTYVPVMLYPNAAPPILRAVCGQCGSTPEIVEVNSNG